jgi:hypothetical protein
LEGHCLMWSCDPNETRRCCSRHFRGTARPRNHPTRSCLWPSGSAGFKTCSIADSQTGRRRDIQRPAGLETCDTADSEACATMAASGGDFELVAQPIAGCGVRGSMAIVVTDR